MKSISSITFKGNNNERDFEILSLSNLSSRIKIGLDHDPNQPHRLNFFMLLIVTGGQGKHSIDFREYTIKAGNVLMISKGQIHAFEKEQNYEGFLILFTERFVLNYFPKSSVEVISRLYNYHASSPIVESGFLNIDFLDQINKELAHGDAYAHINIIASILETYLLRLERLAIATRKDIKTKRQYDLFRKFKNLVEYNYMKTRNVKDYSVMLHISTKHLNQIVKAHTFITAKAYIDNFVILEIKRAILTVNSNLKEIAYLTGFDEPTNFYKFFKKHTGTTPKRFIKSSTVNF